MSPPEVSSDATILRIGTRGSPLALAQAGMVRDALAEAHGLDPARIEFQVIRTTGDRIQDRPLAEAGGKGLFAKEIEEALIDRRIDLAVHSSKDMPTFLPEGLVLSTFLQREDARDAFISRKARNLAELPRGAVVGTSSPRRQALLRRMRRDLKRRRPARQCRDAAAQAGRRRRRRHVAGACRTQAARPRRRGG